jgi:hypothetical protein
MSVLKQIVGTPPLTPHARQRWVERCADIDVDMEWYRAKRLGAKTRKRLCACCPGHREFTGRQFKGFWYMKGPSGVVFVLGGNPPQIITVWRWKQ